MEMRPWAASVAVGSVTFLQHHGPAWGLSAPGCRGRWDCALPSGLTPCQFYNVDGNIYPWGWAGRLLGENRSSLFLAGWTVLPQGHAQALRAVAS